MYAQELSNPAISSKTISHAHQTLQKAIDFVQKIEREFLLMEEIQQTELDTNENDPMRQQISKFNLL